jgi:hypothetical protein
MDQIDPSQITPHLPVFSADLDEIGTVDHVDSGESLKLTKDPTGQHHWIPLAWVSRVDTHVHLSQPASQVREQWRTQSPAG